MRSFIAALDNKATQKQNLTNYKTQMLAYVQKILNSCSLFHG